MQSIVLRIGLGLVLILLGGAALLLGGYGISMLLFPKWPSDYHATLAIALMSVVLLAYAGWAATRGASGKNGSSR